MAATLPESAWTCWHHPLPLRCCPWGIVVAARSVAMSSPLSDASHSAGASALYDP